MIPLSISSQRLPNKRTILWVATEQDLGGQVLLTTFWASAQNMTKTLLFHMQLGIFSRFSFHIQSYCYPGAAWDAIKGEGRAAASGESHGLGGEDDGPGCCP
jgi:hypothetical protein